MVVICLREMFIPLTFLDDDFGVSGWEVLDFDFGVREPTDSVAKIRETVSQTEQEELYEVISSYNVRISNNIPFCAICPDFFTLLKPYKSNPDTSVPSARPRKNVMNWNKLFQ